MQGLEKFFTIFLFVLYTKLKKKLELHDVKVSYFDSSTLNNSTDSCKGLYKHRQEIEVLFSFRQECLELYTLQIMV